MSKEEIIARVEALMQIIAEESKAIIRYVLESDKGVNPKVGKNTLVDSELYNTIGCDVDDIEVVRLFVNDYIDYIENGRASGSFPPPQAIADWCGRKGLPTDNSTVYAICMSIYQKGIAPRPIFEGNDGVWERIDAVFDRWSESIVNAITSNLDEFFNN